MPRISLILMSRAGEWWEFKLVPPLAIAYAAVAEAGHNTSALLPAIAMLLLALVPGAIFVSLLNDWTDLADDAEAGKPNRQHGASRIVPVLAMLACLLAGAVLGWHWRSDPLLVAVYAAGWLAYLAYSVPPLRLKRRGLAGALCDAIGANVVPALLAALLVAHKTGTPPNFWWLAPVAIWSLAFGLRGILWHQMGDIEADRRSGTSTAVMRIGEERTAALVRRLLFPAECAALLAWLAQTGPFAIGMAAIAYALYFHLAYARLDRFEMQVSLVRSVPRSFLLMQEYYDALLPIALLLSSVLVEPWTLVLVALHALLFPRRLVQISKDLWRLRDPQYESRWHPPKR